MVIRRGEIWWADMVSPSGSEPGYRRPVVIIQSDDFNQSKINTIMAIAITSNLRLADAPGNVLLPKNISKLAKDSVINVSQVITLDRDFLSRRISKLPDEIIADIEEGLRLSLDL